MSDFSHFRKEIDSLNFKTTFLLIIITIANALYSSYIVNLKTQIKAIQEKLEIKQ
jgi:hypothetical protein